MKCKLTPGLSSGDWNEFCSRFHFPPDDLPHIQAIYTALLPLVESYAYYSLDQDLDGVSLPHYAYGFVTLGNGVDELSELYLNHEQIQEAYIVDCISLMLLSKAYEEFAHVVERQSRLYLAELSFLGDTYSLDLLPQIYGRLAPDGIQLTEGQMLRPLKTATLILHLDTTFFLPVEKGHGSAFAAYLWGHADIPYKIIIFQLISQHFTVLFSKVLPL